MFDLVISAEKAWVGQCPSSITIHLKPQLPCDFLVTWIFFSCCFGFFSVIAFGGHIVHHRYSNNVDVIAIVGFVLLFCLSVAMVGAHANAKIIRQLPQYFLVYKLPYDRENVVRDITIAYAMGKKTKNICGKDCGCAVACEGK